MLISCGKYIKYTILFLYIKYIIINNLHLIFILKILFYYWPKTIFYLIFIKIIIGLTIYI